MEIKFKKKLSLFEYLLMFDLASKKTGVCLWDLNKKVPIYTKQIVTPSTEELSVYGLKKEIEKCVNFIISEYGINKSGILLYKEAMPTQVHGGSSTVQTFLALAKSHAVLDLYAFENGFPVYDYIGVYPITTHSYLKKLNGWDNNHKVDKTDIQKYVEQRYGVSKLTPDEYDAIFLALTFIEVKWNKDLEEEIKVVKRHKKELKMQHALNQCDAEMQRLEKMKI